MSRSVDTPNAADTALNVPEHLRPSTMRALGMTPDMDIAVDAIKTVPTGLLKRFIVAGLIQYRRLRPQSIGNRCVFEPSCSRYSELAFRQNTLLKAFRLTLDRLRRCRPGNGGLDTEKLEQPKCNIS